MADLRLELTQEAEQNIAQTLDTLIEAANEIAKASEQDFEKLKSKKLKNIDTYYDNGITHEDFERLNTQYQERIDKLNEQIQIEREKDRAIENKDSLIDEICATVKQLVYFEKFNDSIAKEILDHIIIHSKSNIEVYLKGINDKAFFFTDEENILDNNYLYQSKDLL